jgi:RND family efflux transporter MFP subunit
VDGTVVSDLKNDLAALRIEREPERKHRRWVKWVVLLILFAAAAGAGWQWFTRERPVTVQVANVTERAAGTRAAVLNASGYVTARRRATVSSKITGRVMEVNVEEGMMVREGQILARLDDSTPRAALALAEAQVMATRQAVRELEVRLDEAQRTQVRREQLLKAGISAPADVDQINAEVESLKARIQATRSQVEVAERQAELQRTDVDNTIIRAPFSGVAISKDAQPGEMVSPVSAGGGFTRTGISTLVDMSSLEIEVDVNESYINRVRQAQRVTAVLDAYPDWQIPARVITTVPTADRQTATVLVRIGFEKLDPRILPDMGVKVTFLREDEEKDAAAAQPVALVPRSAIKTAGGQSFVFVIAGERVDRRAISTGGVDGERIEVVAGLRAGERVVVSPPDTLAAGDLVQIDAS